MFKARIGPCLLLVSVAFLASAWGMRASTLRSAPPVAHAASAHDLASKMDAMHEAGVKAFPATAW